MRRISLFILLLGAQTSLAKTEAPPKVAASTAAVAAPRPDLNAMTGKVMSLSSDPKVLRITVDGGYNVEFTYDAKTVVHNGGSAIQASDLSYDDRVVVRYAGKELNAVEIERVSKTNRAVNR